MASGVAASLPDKSHRAVEFPFPRSGVKWTGSSGRLRSGCGTEAAVEDSRGGGSTEQYSCRTWVRWVVAKCLEQAVLGVAMTWVKPVKNKKCIFPQMVKGEGVSAMCRGWDVLTVRSVVQQARNLPQHVRASGGFANLLLVVEQISLLPAEQPGPSDCRSSRKNRSLDKPVCCYLSCRNSLLHNLISVDSCEEQKKHKWNLGDWYWCNWKLCLKIICFYPNSFTTCV